MAVHHKTFLELEEKLTNHSTPMQRRTIIPFVYYQVLLSPNLAIIARPKAAELLSLMACLTNTGFQSLFCRMAEGRLEFEDAMALLTSFSLIKAWR